MLSTRRFPTPNSLKLPFNNDFATVNAIFLPNAGTYVIGGQQPFFNNDPKVPAYIACALVTSFPSLFELADGAPQSTVTVPPASSATIPLNGYYIADKPDTTLMVECSYGSANNVFASDVEAARLGHVHGDPGEIDLGVLTVGSRLPVARRQSLHAAGAELAHVAPGTIQMFTSDRSQLWSRRAAMKAAEGER